MGIDAFEAILLMLIGKFAIRSLIQSIAKISNIREKHNWEEKMNRHLINTIGVSISVIFLVGIHGSISNAGFGARSKIRSRKIFADIGQQIVYTWMRVSK
jgi:hypothetical protein